MCRNAVPRNEEHIQGRRVLGGAPDDGDHLQDASAGLVSGDRLLVPRGRFAYWFFSNAFNVSPLYNTQSTAQRADEWCVRGHDSSVEGILAASHLCLKVERKKLEKIFYILSLEK